MDRRYLLAVLFSVLILVGYPHYLRWIGFQPSEKAEAPRPEKIVIQKEIISTKTKEAAPVASEAYPYHNELYDLLFTNHGGGLVLLKQGNAVLYQAHLEEGGIFGLTLQEQSEDLTQIIFKTQPPPKKGASPIFIYEKTGEYRMTKRFFVGREKPTLILEVELENLSGRQRSFPLEFRYAMELGPNAHTQDESYAKLVRFSATELQAVSLGTLKKKPFPSAGLMDWHGLIRKYYALLVKPDLKLTHQETRFEGGRLISALGLTPISVEPGGKKMARFLIYAGPQSYETLRSFGFGFEKILSQGALGAFKVALLTGLNFFYRLTQNYGAAILLATLLLKLLFTPLTHLSYGSMGKMQALQPKLKALQRQYQKDPSRLNKEVMDLYKRNRVNPMMGCLPMVLQIPIFIAFYQVLSEAVELKGAGFLWWIKDLSEPDRLFTWPVSLPFVGNAFNLLPILMIGSMLWQQKLTPQTAATPEQEKLMYFMPVIFGFVFYNLPSGLVLYWFVNNVLTIFHQLVIKRIPVILHHEDA